MREAEPEWQVKGLHLTGPRSNMPRPKNRQFPVQKATFQKQDLTENPGQGQKQMQ
jgi:hypothetical protein